MGICRGVPLGVHGQAFKKVFRKSVRAEIYPDACGRRVSDAESVGKIKLC